MICTQYICGAKTGIDRAILRMYTYELRDLACPSPASGHECQLHSLAINNNTEIKGSKKRIKGIENKMGRNWLG